MEEGGCGSPTINIKMVPAPTKTTSKKKAAVKRPKQVVLAKPQVSSDDIEDMFDSVIAGCCTGAIVEGKVKTGTEVVAEEEIADADSDSDAVSEEEDPEVEMADSDSEVVSEEDP
jgi:hypothetical protein